ncbi:Cdc6/Cdc18 family protein [Haloglomus salinum]|uniref:Cdc6/Cdc18 family protein n=1 Tax=Haloglomus salinum TaxID=2962673 RepID=UPI0020C998D9|nr:Cdc6/Cdc18 family protein [Haloglomus salinum]
MIGDARVLQPEFVPREVEHRDGEVDALTNALDPITRGESGETAFLFGPSGTGKTCIAQYTVERLREQVVDIEYQYVNCWRDYTRYRALYRILEGIEGTLDIHRQSTPTDELSERLRSYNGSPYVVVLDEVDQLQGTGVLYDLYSAHDCTMVLIANRETDVFDDLDDRLSSRLHSARRVRFDKYGLDELVTILEARVRRGLTTDVDRMHLEHIADAAAGDARIAIGILRNAARDAERAGREELTTDLVKGAVPEARQQVRRTNLETLTEHQRVLYDIIDEQGEVDPGELYGQYQERVADPKTNRTVRNHLQKMVHYDLVVAEGEKRARTYRTRN